MAPTDPQPDFRALLDQAEAALKDMAPVLGTYFRALLDEGFTREEALTLVVNWQAMAQGDPDA